MPKLTKRPGGPQWTAGNVPTQLPDWEAARIFLEVSRCGSFRAAAQKLGQSVNALRRTVERFEKDLGVQLLTRHVRGVELTEEGKRISDSAARMEGASFDLMMARNASDTQAQGDVRLSIPEGLGTYWLLPYLTRFQGSNPGLALEMRCAQKPADLSRLEADISIQLQRPTEPDLTVLKLGRLHMVLWASSAYLAEHGRPVSRADLRKHRFSVLIGNDQSGWEVAYQNGLGIVPSPSTVTLRTNSGNTHFWTVVSGAAIGVLPTYPAVFGTDLVLLDLIEPFPTDVWLVYHPSAKRISRIRKVIDCIVQAFDARRMPWFRDEFIHPDRFAQLYKGPPIPGAPLIPSKRSF